MTNSLSYTELLKKYETLLVDYQKLRQDHNILRRACYQILPWLRGLIQTFEQQGDVQEAVSVTRAESKVVKEPPAIPKNLVLQKRFNLTQTRLQQLIAKNPTSTARSIMRHVYSKDELINTRADAIPQEFKDAV
ncbi:unnamed protein product, partial [Didymodactylos carnosus]